MSDISRIIWVFLLSRCDCGEHKPINRRELRFFRLEDVLSASKWRSDERRLFLRRGVRWMRELSSSNYCLMMLFSCFSCVHRWEVKELIVPMLSRSTSRLALKIARYSLLRHLLGLIISLFWLIGVTGADGRLGGLESHCVFMLLLFYLACICSSLPLSLSFRFLPIECR
jgi:hypothetical protein